MHNKHYQPLKNNMTMTNIEIRGRMRPYRFSVDDDTFQVLRQVADRHGWVSKNLLAQLYFPIGNTPDSARRSWGRMVNCAHQPDGLRLTDVLSDIERGWRASNSISLRAAAAIAHFCGPLPDTGAGDV